MREFYWPRLRDLPTDDPLWVKLYGKEQANRAEEEFWNIEPDGIWFEFTPYNKAFEKVIGRFQHRPATPFWYEPGVDAFARIESASPGHVSITYRSNIFLSLPLTAAGVMVMNLPAPFVYQPVRAYHYEQLVSGAWFRIPDLVTVERFVINMTRPRSKKK